MCVSVCILVMACAVVNVSFRLFIARRFFLSVFGPQHKYITLSVYAE